MNCARCQQPIADGEMYFEAIRRGTHDRSAFTAAGFQLHHVPLHIHVDCPDLRSKQ